MADDERLWDIEDVSEYLGIPVSSIYHMTGPKAGLRIPHIKLSSRLRFRRTEIDEWLALLSVSNTDLLARARQQARGGRRGHDP